MSMAYVVPTNMPAQDAQRHALEREMVPAGKCRSAVRVQRIKLPVNNAVKRHGAGAGGDHCQEDEPE